MRRFGGRTGREESDYQRGYRVGAVHAVTTLIGLAIGVRAVLWASRNSVVESVIAWGKEPTTLNTWLIALLSIVVIVWLIGVAMQYIGRSA